ncbi:MAG: aminotransferase class I/II-fold pyridoxal phosphate-dependent enzyme [Planctomycetota bacterium]
MHIQTLAVHAGKQQNSIGVVTPIEPTSAFHYFEEPEQLYPRYFNTPNQKIVAQQVADLEGAEAGMVFSSGMAAISTTLLSFLSAGDHVVLQKALYGGTHAFVSKAFAGSGIEYTLADNDAESILTATQPNTKVIYVETPANPLLEVIDLRRLGSFSKPQGILTIVDSTFASPICQNPIELGIDLVVHSGTKYLGGHSDLSFGAVAGSQEQMERIWDKAILFGGSVNALTCYLIERSLKTLGLRVRQQSENALEIARYLSSKADITQVNYPGLASHPNHELAVEQMSGFGGMLSFCPPSHVSPQAFLKALKLIAPAMSLGGVESTVTIPALTSHKPMPARQRQEIGIEDHLVRLSVGIESAEDLILDLEQAFDRSDKTSTTPQSHFRVYAEN